MNRHWLTSTLAASLTSSFLAFSFLGFFGLDGSTQEYGSLSGALRRTIAQALPPYHETKDTAQILLETGQVPGTTAPAQPSPPASSESTPKAQ